MNAGSETFSIKEFSMQLLNSRMLGHVTLFYKGACFRMVSNFLYTAQSVVEQSTFLLNNNDSGRADNLITATHIQKSLSNFMQFLVLYICSLNFAKESICKLFSITEKTKEH